MLLYNGTLPWTAADTLEPLIEPAPPLLARITDLQQLEELGDQLLISANGDDWLQAVRNICAGEEE